MSSLQRERDARVDIVTIPVREKPFFYLTITVAFKMFLF